MQYIDLTHTFHPTMPTYPGDPEAELSQVAVIEKNGYNVSQIKSGMHVGTHLDAPLHMIADGKRVSEYSPEHFFGRGHLIDARGYQSIDVELLQNHQISKGGIVLILTGFDKKFGNPDYYQTYPEISTGFAAKMVEFGVKIIGMDTPSPDRAPFDTHKLLLANDVLIIENLKNLDKLGFHPNFEIIALPAKYDAEAAPVRIIAKIFTKNNQTTSQVTP